ncbi:acetamidase/formamidase family protein [Novosphingobium album (ex Liu et al. 2023)]|uniref:Acetamidase/formamidase family protein n=1 Tax=Novosphingobium album (ex Liu et al. 2023) TaxID=3031130 RepID=A0ABT5WQG3_9SPHN|nr:acetamidase/formamidase family protein [Novosphingobium album (ex Liu et al. 2023)]MDE8652001.1 acetamidase/formamidase family protein [Novosphingobium album (ex Liu et al. 2023)]
MPNTVEVKRSGETAKDDPNCFNRLHWAIEPVAHANPGDYIVYETRDAFDDQFTMATTAEEVAGCDLNRVHPMTGPVYIEGAERGDALAVTIVDIAPADYGYTVIVPGFGFLRDVIPGPFIANWQLDRLCAVSEQIPGVRIPMCAFPGSIGVLPGKPEVAAALEREGALAAAGGFALMPDPGRALPARLFAEGAPYAAEGLRTVAPRENGGNMDIKAMQVGTTVLFPVLVEGAGLWTGDIHFAQGDGEVCGTAVEMAARVTLKCEVIKGGGKDIVFPHVSGGGQLRNADPGRFHAVVGMPVKQAGEVPPHLAYLDSPKVAALTNLSEDLTLAARDALLRMIDWIARTKGYSREQAYAICAAAVDLRIGQLVDVPNIIVSAVLPLDIFVD